MSVAMARRTAASSESVEAMVHASKSEITQLASVAASFVVSSSSSSATPW